MTKVYKMIVICNKCNWHNFISIEVFNDGSVLFNEICHNVLCKEKIIHSEYNKKVKSNERERHK